VQGAEGNAQVQQLGLVNKVTRRPSPVTKTSRLLKMPPNPKLNKDPTFRRRYVGTCLVPLLHYSQSTALTHPTAGLLASTGGSEPSVEAYYGSLESRLGYWLVLGNARHCGLYAKGQLSPFPLSTAQRAMEDKLFTRLGLKPGDRVLDAGAGSIV